MLKTDRYKKVTAWFAKNMADAQTELHYHTTFQLLVAVVLSAQCTDKRVNMVTPALFAQMGTPEMMAQASVDEIFAYISSVSYPRAKATHLSQSAKLLVEEFDSEVPSTRIELETLPGVGRKTASVILSVAFGQNEMAVDTHVHRVANRIGLTKNARTPLETEKQLVDRLKNQDLGKAHHWLILHGRYICTARSPHCQQCGIA
ncbi:MAG: endonuclease III [Mucinivorans sp.]